MRPVAKRHFVGVLASTKERLLAFGRFPFDGLKAAALVGPVAKWLPRGLPAGAPEVRPGLHLLHTGASARNFRISHEAM